MVSFENKIIDPDSRENPHRSPKRGWIDCSHKLPTSKGTYLGLTNTDNIQCIQLGSVREDSIKTMFDDFTHWMDVNDILLPAKKKKKEEIVLKGCPFHEDCSAKVELWGNGDGWRVEANCGLKGFGRRTYDEAKQAWNMRADLFPQSSESKKYTKLEIIEALKGHCHFLGMFNYAFEGDIGRFVFLDQIEELMK